MSELGIKNTLAKGACENICNWMLQNIVMRYPEVDSLVGSVNKDNLDVTIFVKNQHVTARTKHIDVKAHFIWKLVLTKEDSADILNKNCPGKPHKSAIGILIVGGRMLRKSIYNHQTVTVQLVHNY